ncbi:unnamed protein product [Protopolystoma xenopodis]|uniref:Uncharacterized protein n=1 Tax=Protopolystoma xenopodis TaxID=117903 RepID=A0A448XID1_9PLAT|nr:unnamed protein product [Protopolystoma xenopodis]
MQVVLTLSNPAHRTTLIRLRQLSADEELSHLAHLSVSTTKSSVTSASSVEAIDTNQTSDSSASVGLKASQSANPIFSTVQLGLPSSDLFIAAHSDVLDYEDAIGTEAGSEFVDDPKFACP